MAGPTQFKSTDTRRWWLGFGNGSDGDLTISSNTTEAPIDSACTGTATQNTISATNASFASGQAVLIHQTQGTGAGQWELGYITGYTAGTITLKDALYYSYGTGAQVRVLKQYKNVTINTGVTYTAKAWNGTVGGILGFLANGTVTVTGTITATGKGFRGGDRGYGAGLNGTGNQGESAVGTGSRTYTANGSGGGGGTVSSTNEWGNGGGGGGYGTVGTNGTEDPINKSGSEGIGGTTDGVAALTDMVFGGGGGGGGIGDNISGVTSTTGDGGNGGGLILIISKSIPTITGSISTNGQGGYDGSGDQASGGGGAGGSVLIKTQSGVLGTTKITSSGGAGGTAGNDGGNGGVGRIHIDYVVSYSGTTSPTLDATQDLTLRQPIQRRLVI